MQEPVAVCHEGLQLMQAEMARQCGDALASMDSNAALARAAAESARTTGRVVLYGIGGSHYVNRSVEPLYRELGLDCRALGASEALMSPLPDVPRTAMVVSQSGESGEILDLLARPPGQERRFGITLEGGSTLARRAEAALVGAGGTEHAFAATRSIVVTLALHAAILGALGMAQDAFRTVLAADAPADTAAVDVALADCDVVAFAGRHVLQGIAESGALSMMELARVPTIGWEGGQFRHGPFEFLRPGLGILLLRSAGVDGPGVAPIASACVAAGCTVAVFDSSGEAPLPGCLTVTLPRNAGLAAGLSMLLSFQPLNIAVARRRVAERIGTPVRTSKVTV